MGVLLVGTIVTCLLLRKRKIRRQAQVDPPEASERPISTATAVDSRQPGLKPMSMTYTPSMIYVRTHCLPSIRLASVPGDC